MRHGAFIDLDLLVEPVPSQHLVGVRVERHAEGCAGPVVPEGEKVTRQGAVLPGTLVVLHQTVERPDHPPLPRLGEAPVGLVIEPAEPSREGDGQPMLDAADLHKKRRQCRPAQLADWRGTAPTVDA